MGEPAAARAGAKAPEADGDGSEQDRLAELRTIIIGPERVQLRALQARLDDHGAQVRQVSDVLPQAVLLRAHDSQLATALGPSVEDAITASVRKNPKPLADALFPVIGPAIRKAIAHALSAMIDNLNRTLEHSVSWQAIGWRLTALRTGKSFAEVVLLNTLVYRVEQVFLIERRSGLLLQHVTPGAHAIQDADLVSGMLTAIRDFVQDSFKVEENEALETFKVGELSVWIEQGPRALLAAVIRGNAPPELRGTMQDALDMIHLQFADALERFGGDDTEFEAARPVLDSCLQSQYHPQRKKRSLLLPLLAVALLAGLGLWAFSRMREQRRWSGYLERLRSEPGLVVVSSGRSGGRYFLTGLRDPLATDPTALLANTGIGAEDVSSQWDFYQDLDARFTLTRARQVLRPPPGVDLTLRNGVLEARGDAPSGWILESRRLVSLLPGVARFDDSVLVAGAVQSAVAGLESTPLRFVRGTSRLVSGEDARLALAAAELGRLDTLAQASGQRFRLHIVGHTDADGLAATNLLLSQARAERIAGALLPKPLPAIDLVVRGVGSGDPSRSENSDLDKQENRRVSFRVESIGGAALPATRP